MEPELLLRVRRLYSTLEYRNLSDESSDTGILTTRSGRTHRCNERHIDFRRRTVQKDSDNVRQVRMPVRSPLPRGEDQGSEDFGSHYARENDNTILIKKAHYPGQANDAAKEWSSNFTVVIEGATTQLQIPGWDTTSVGAESKFGRLCVWLTSSSKNPAGCTHDPAGGG